MKKIIFIITLIFLSGCGVDFEVKSPNQNENPDIPSEQTNHQQIVEDLKSINLLASDDFSTPSLDYVNSTPTSIGSDNGIPLLNLNQGLETDQYVQTSEDLVLSDKITLSLWFKTTDPYSIQTLLWQGVSTQNGWGSGQQNASYCEFNITLNHWTDTSGQFLTVFYGFDEHPDTDISSTELMPVSFPYHQPPNNAPAEFTGPAVDLNYDWNHVVVVMDKNPLSVTISLYYNGDLVQSQTGYQVDTSLWDSNFRIGRPGVNSRKFKGQISDFLMFDKLLSAEEIQSLYLYGQN